MQIIDKSRTLATYPYLAKKNSVFGDRIETTKTERGEHSVNAVYFNEGGTNTVVKIEVFSNLTKFCEIYDVVVANGSVLVCIFEHNTLDYAIIRSESERDVTILCLDTAEVLNAEHFTGSKDFSNEEYVNYSNCFSFSWADLTQLDNDLFLVEKEISVGERSLNFCRFAHDSMSSNCTFQAVSSEDIVIEGEVDVDIVGDLIEITDCPHGRNIRTRQYIDHPDIDSITRIVNRSDLNAAMMINELSMACCEFATTTSESPEKEYQISWIKTKYLFAFLHDFGDTDKPKVVIIENKNAQRKVGEWLISWSEHKEMHKESEYVVMKRKKGHDIIVVDLQFWTTCVVTVPNRVEREESVTTCIEISPDGEKLFVMGNIIGVVPFFSVYKTDLKRDTIERMICKNSADYRSDCSVCWEGDRLVINADEDEYDHEFEIEKNRLVRTV